ncbi:MULTISPECIES: acyltransferase [unclassified Rhizobium]|uniref:acyltransferase family protein n=1 Tax=unclassified Rhizobium TaxID=2613769 RepID=UPI00116074ED|nr:MULTISPECIES: acyltransferase [unclassified Rhizobium]TQX82850.1 acyltransferase [Rhizobium sp. rho-13.1]TQY07022.1 acyltransferase [Rhizobium sp. rho-1.1]
MKNTRKREYVTIDALRGVAALVVVLFHSSAMLGTQYFPKGYLAVDLFFVLSGFVISHVYDSRLASGMTIKTFSWIRITRFYPLYLAGLVIGVVRELALQATGSHFAMPGSEFLISAGFALFLLPFPIPGLGGNLYNQNTPAWSLIYELIVNIAYAIALPFLTKRILAAICLVTAVGLVVVGGNAGTLDGGALVGDVGVALLRTTFSFSLGALVYRLKLTRIPIPSLLILAATVVALMGVRGSSITYDLLFVFAVSPVLLILAAGNEPSNSFMPIAVFLGMASFPIYAIHRPLLLLAEAAGNLLHLPLSLFWAVTVAFILASTYPIVRWYDAPFRRWLQRTTAIIPAVRQPSDTTHA